MPRAPVAPVEESGDELDLAGLLEELHRQYGKSVSYYRVWNLLVSKRAPARRYGNRWLVLRADLPVLAEALGLVQPPGGSLSPGRPQSRDAATAAA